MDLPCFFFLSLFDGVDGGVQAQAIRAVITPSAGMAEMKFVKRRNWDSLSAAYYCFHSFSSKQETATQSGESAYADHSDKFFMSMFHLKADENDGERGY